MIQKGLFKQFFSVSGLIASNRFLALLMGMLIARSVTPHEYGIYSYILSVVSIASIPVISGVQLMLSKGVALAASKSEHKKYAELILCSRYHVVVAGSASILVLLICSIFLEYLTLPILILCIGIVLLRAMLSRGASILYGLEHYHFSQFGALILVPLSILLLLIIANMAELTVNVIWLLFFSLVATLIAFGFTTVILIKKSLNPVPWNAVVKPLMLKHWYSHLFTFGFASTLFIINTEYVSLVLAWLSSAEQIAYYKIALHGAAVLSLFSMASNYVLNPKIARLYEDKRYAECQSVLDTSVRTNTMISIPLVIMLYFFGHDLLSILFGDNYISAYTSLMIFAVAHLVNVATGSVGVVLNMTGNEKVTAQTLGCTMLLSVPLTFLFISFYGSAGAALGAASCIILWNIWMARKVVQLTNLRTWLAIAR